MRFLPLVLKHLRATWVRSASTVVAMSLCVFLFCSLESFLAHFGRFIAGRSPRRLVTRNAASLVGTVPLPAGERIRTVPGVKRVAATFMFSGVLPARKEGRGGAEWETDWTSVSRNAAVDAEPYFAMSPELVVPPEQFHFRYLSEGLGGLQRTHLFTVEIDDPARAGEVAAAIDALFDNSSDETYTETESAFMAELVSMVGDLGTLVHGIGLAVCFTILLVTANTMSMAVRERRTEVAVLKGRPTARGPWTCCGSP